MNRDTCEGALLSSSDTHLHTLRGAQVYLGMWPGVFNRSCSWPPSTCTVVRRDTGHCRFMLTLLGYVVVLALVQMNWLGYSGVLRSRLSPWLYDSPPWRQGKNTDLIIHTAAVSVFRRGLGGLKKVWDRSKGWHRDTKNKWEERERCVMLTAGQ